MKRLAIALIVLAVAAPALSGTVPKLVPYQGVLEKDGALVNAVGDDQVAFRVNLYDAAEDGNLLWGPQDLSSNVYSGRFALILGPYTHVADTPLYLDIQVQGPDDDSFVPLGGRQRLLSSPYAVAADRADTDFDVPGTLTVTGDASVGGSQAVGTQLSAGGNLTIGGSISAVANLFLGGTAYWTCPPAAAGRAGSWCMTNIRGPAQLASAAMDCHNIGMNICNLDAIMQCDLVNQPDDGSGESCGEVTDETGTPNGRTIFTVNYNNFFGSTGSSDVFQNLTCFNSFLAGVSENSGVICNMAQAYHYFCCSPVNPNLSKGAVK